MRRILDIFLSPGRITRGQFWLGHAVLAATAVVLGAVLGFAAGIVALVLKMEQIAIMGPVVIGFTVGILLLAGELRLGVKRMHDRGASGVWVIAVVGLAALTNFMLGTYRLQNGEAIVTPLSIGLAVFTAIMGCWLIVELGFLRGTRGKNRYGDDPGGAIAADGDAMLLTESMTSDGTSRA